MAVTKQKPCINDTVLQLAKEAAIGDVFIYSGNEYQWTMRSEAWEGIMLTKTERGFELIDKNGRSHGIVNLGEPYHNIDPHPSCTACGKDYVFQNAVECITAVCCDQELYVGNCAEKGWSVDWCELNTEQLNPPNIEIEFSEWQPTGTQTVAEAQVLTTVSIEPQDKFPVSKVAVKITVDGTVTVDTEFPLVGNQVVIDGSIIAAQANKEWRVEARSIADDGTISEPTVLAKQTPPFTVVAPSKPDVTISLSLLVSARSVVVNPDDGLRLTYNWSGSNGGAPIVSHTMHLYKDGTLISKHDIDVNAPLPYDIETDHKGAGVYKLVGEVTNAFGMKATDEDSIELEMPPLPAPTIELEFANFGGKRTNDVRAHINPTDTSPYNVDKVEYWFSDGVTAAKEGVIEEVSEDGTFQFTVIDPYPKEEVTVRARNVSGVLKSDWTEVKGITPAVEPDAPTLRIKDFEQVGSTITAHANFRWAANNVGTGGSPILGYNISYREKGTGNVIVVPTGEFSPNIDFDMVGLKPNTVYTYWSTVYNEVGHSPTFVTDFTTPPLQLSFDEMVLTGVPVTTAIANLPAQQARNVINQQAAGSLRIDRTEIIDTPFSSFAGEVPNAVLHKVVGVLNIDTQDIGTAICLRYKANEQLLAAVQASVQESQAWARIISSVDNNTINSQFASTAAQFAGNGIGSVFFVAGAGGVEQPRGFNNNNSGLMLSGHSVGNSNAVYLFDFSEVEIRVAQ